MKKWQERLSYGFLIVLLAIYPVYTNLLYGSADDQLNRHLKFIEGKSPYFNPWQYRILAPYFIEMVATPIKTFLNNANNEAELYFRIFKCFRFMQHILIFSIAYKFYSLFTYNRLLPFASLIVLSASMGAATYVSDFSFNTYFDILFFLAAVYIIFANKNIYWFLPLMLIAALNRETSLLIPFLLFIKYQKFLCSKTQKKYWSVLLGSLVIYFIIFILIRMYYGYQAPNAIGMQPGWPMLSYNLTNPVTIIQLFATLSILPLFTLLNIQKADARLQILFWLLVPIWFSIHFWLVWAHETRLFLVPLTIVFIPIMLDLIQKSFEKNTEA